MGVFMSSSSFLITSRRSGRGLLGSCEGRVVDFGVLRTGKEGLGDLGVAVWGEVVLMVGGVDMSVSVVVDAAGEVGFSVSMTVGMVTVDLERPRCQTNDSRHDLTGDACCRPRVSRGSSSEQEGKKGLGVRANL